MWLLNIPYWRYTNMYCWSLVVLRWQWAAGVLIFYDNSSRQSRHSSGCRLHGRRWLRQQSWSGDQRWRRRRLSGSEPEESGGGSGTPCLPAELFLQPGEHCLPLLVHVEVCWVHSMSGSYCHLWQNRRREWGPNADVVTGECLKRKRAFILAKETVQKQKQRKTEGTRNNE